MTRLNPIGTGRTVTVLLLVSILLAGCGQESEILTVQNSADNRNQTVGIELKHATLTVNGKTLTERLNLADDSFHIFYVFVKEGGIFAISTTPYSLFVEAGHFRGNKLEVNLNGFQIEATTQSEHVLSDGVAQIAWVLHIPEFRMFAPGVKVADFVVGLADEVNQIPGFARE